MANTSAPTGALTLDEADAPPDARPGTPGRAPTRTVLVFGMAVVLVLAALVCWMGWHFSQARQDRDAGNLFLQTARQGALNLTTVDWRHAEDDVRRIMDGATGEFYDDFAQRSQPFVEVVKKAQSVSVGTVTAAGLESHSSQEAQALVAVSVTTSNSSGPNQPPRSWRMRIAVHKVDGQVKVSRVEFVP
jgi:Mce-associated membrane protein